MPTDGAVASAKLIGDSKVDLAIIRGDLEVPKNAQAVATLRKNVAVLDRNDPEKKLGFYVDEWGTWYDVEKGTNAGFLYQHRPCHHIPQPCSADDRPLKGAPRGIGQFVGNTTSRPPIRL